MPKLACKIPRKVALACSGGIDSMSALDFLLKGRREVKLVHFNHNTPGSDKAEQFVIDTARQRGLECVVRKAPDGLPQNEKSWRDARYDFFSELEEPIVLAHHLDDAVEWWVFTSFRGQPRLIPIERSHKSARILRPFLFFTKSQLTRFNDLGYCEDPSNVNLKHARNRIRHNVIPEAIKVNPGLKKTVMNLYRRKIV